MSTDYFIIISNHRNKKSRQNDKIVTPSLLMCQISVLFLDYDGVCTYNKIKQTIL